VAQRAAFMAEKVKLEVKGVIENMAWFTGDDGTRYELFGAGGGQELAQRLEVPLLGQVPLVPVLREGSDAGRPVVATEPDIAHARDGPHGGLDPVGDLVAQGAAGDGEGDEHVHVPLAPDLDLAQHAELDDRAVQLGILHRPQGLDDLLRSHGHGWDAPRRRALGDLHYGDR
jgi:hypothetical protein